MNHRRQATAQGKKMFSTQRHEGHKVRNCLLSSLCLCGYFISPAPQGNAETASPPLGTPPQVHNRIVYVPFGELDRVFGKERKGILMNYDRYMDVWTLAEGRKPKEPESVPPIGAAMSSAEYRGAVSGDLASFEASFKINVLKDGAVACPFDFQGVGLASVTVGDKGASLFTDAGRLSLVVDGKGEKPAAAAYSVKVAGQEASRSLRFRVPYAPAATMTLDLPGEAKIENTSVPYTINRNEAADTTTLLLALGGQSEVAFSWTLKEARAVEEPVVLVESLFQFSILPGSLRLGANLRASILRTQVSELTLTLPAAYDLVGYDVPNLRNIETVEQAGGKALHMTFHEPQSGELNLHFSAEAARPGAGPVTFPQVSLLGAQRQNGKLLVQLHESLLARVTTEEGVRRFLNVAAPAESTPWLRLWRAFTFWQPGYSLAFEVTTIPAETRAEVKSLFELREQQWLLSSKILYKVKKGERLDLRFELPPDWAIVEVTAGGQEVEWSETTESGARLVEIALPGKLANGGSFECELRCKLIPDGWLSDDWTIREVKLPVLWVQDATEQDGWLGVDVDPQFELNDRALRGLKSEDVRKVTSQGYSSDALALGYSFRRRYEGKLEVTRRSPRIGATVTQFVQADRDVMRVHALVDYRIDYAATNELWLALPEGTGREVDIRGEDIKEKSLTTRPGESGEVWKIGLHRKRSGSYPLTVSYEKKIASGEANVAVGEVRAVNVNRQSGFIAIEASSDIELHPATKNLIEVDVSEIPPHPTYRPSSRLIYGYKWLTIPFELALGIVRHEQMSVLATVISQARYVTVVDDDGLARTQVTFTVKNATTPNLKLALPRGTVLWSAIVAGQPVKPALSGGFLSIPLLVAEQEEKVFPVVLTYETALGALGALGTLSLAGVRVVGVPVTSTEWQLYLPERYQYLSHDGNMDELSPPQPGTEFVAVSEPMGPPIYFDLLHDPEASRIMRVLNNLRQLGALLYAREASQKMRALNNLRQLGEGMVQYIDQFGKGRYYTWSTGEEEAQRGTATSGPGVGWASEVLDKASEQAQTSSGEKAGAGVHSAGRPSDVGYASKSGKMDIFKGKKARQAAGRFLSMDIGIPTLGMTQSFKRLGGDPEIKLSFVSRSFAHKAGAFITVAAALLAAFLCVRRRMHPLFLLFVSAVVLLGIPRTLWESFAPFCHAALLGVAIYVAFRGVRWLEGRLAARTA